MDASDHPAGGDNAEIEALLRAARPLPDPDWQAGTQRRLLPPPRARQRTRPLFVGIATAAAVAAFALALALAGASPFDQRDADEVQATDACHWVTLVERRREPTVVRGRNGRTEIEYRRMRERHQVRRCD